MDSIFLKARAKINLNLLILNKRKDNYHNLKSVFQKINLYDELYIEKTFNDEFSLITNIDSLNNNDNIISKAYVKLKEKYKEITGVKVILNKKIPMQAGLGGGSTDCASFIIGINKLFNLGLSKKEMEIIGKSLGADVVPCLYNRALLAKGIGEKITTINTRFKYYIVIIKPNMGCNTKEMYSLIDQKKDIVKLDLTNNIISGLEQNNISLIANSLFNTFEYVQPDDSLIQNLKKEFIRLGALGSLLAGSGACVFGIFDDKKIAKNAFSKLKNNYQAYICTSYNSKRSEKFD